MTQITTYSMETFIANVREVFATQDTSLARAQGIAEEMKRLLKEPHWLDDKVGQQRGRVDLYVDDQYGHPGPGFLLMCSRSERTATLAAPQPAPTESGAVPHDHGASFVVYGIYKGAGQQIKYQWSYPPGQWTSPRLVESGRFIQQAGEVAFFLPGEIHSTAPAGDGVTVIVRLEAQKLERVTRHRYNLQDNTAILVPARE